MKDTDLQLIWESYLTEQPVPGLAAPAAPAAPAAAVAQPTADDTTNPNQPKAPSAITPAMLKQAPSILRAVAQLFEDNNQMLQKLITDPGATAPVPTPPQA